MFVTAVSDWRIGDTFVASNGQLFRILAIEPEADAERSPPGPTVTMRTDPVRLR